MSALWLSDAEIDEMCVGRILSAAEHLRQISPRGWRTPRAELLMRARGGP